jgi:nitrite reductase/ring-hydroxylating ferredoxin subunit
MRQSDPVALDTDSIAALVDLDAGTVAGRAFVDDHIYDVELERVFARAWCFLCDAAELTAPGQFVTTFTGEDPVAIVRQHDGSIRAMLNSCRHRGMPVCGPAGQATQLTCGYHGWTYDLDGRLVGVLDGDEDFRRWAEERQLALVPVTRTAHVGELLFGTWDACAAGELDRDDSRLLMAIEAVRGDQPLVRHPRPMRIEENWKVVVEVLGTLAEREGGVTVFPSLAILPTRGLVAAVHPKGPGGCEVALSASARRPVDGFDALRLAIETELEPEGPRTVLLSLKPRVTAPDGCPVDEVPVTRPPRHIDGGATARLYRAWIEHMTDDSPLTGLGS